MVGDILCHYRPSADEGVMADSMSADDRAVSPKSSTFLHEGGADLVHLGNFCPGVVDVRKNHRGSAEDAIFQSHTFVNTDVVL